MAKKNVEIALPFGLLGSLVIRPLYYAIKAMIKDKRGK